VTTLQTERLTIRPWAEADRAAYVAINADPRVGEWLGGPFTEAETSAAFDRLMGPQPDEQWTWAGARKADGAIVGMFMLRRVTGDDHPRAGEVEVGWRLAPAAWGHGYASEAARAIIAFGFSALDVDELVAFTATTNLRSQAVMRRIGLERDERRDFEHPRLAKGHPLRAHVVFAVGRAGR
jgi:RimJ/RimL family protein N-acetyltransferase